MRHAIANTQFAPRIVQHDIEKLQGTAQGTLQSARMQDGVTEKIETAGPHRPGCKTEELIVYRLGNQPPQATVLDIRDRLGQSIRQTDCRHQWRGIDATLAHAFQSIFNEAGCDIMAFHGLNSIAKTIIN